MIPLGLLFPETGLSLLLLKSYLSNTFRKSWLMKFSGVFIKSIWVLKKSFTDFGKPFEANVPFSTSSFARIIAFLFCSVGACLIRDTKFVMALFSAGLKFRLEIPHLKITGSTEITNQRIEIANAFHIGKHSFKLL